MKRWSSYTRGDHHHSAQVHSAAAAPQPCVALLRLRERCLPTQHPAQPQLDVDAPIEAELAEVIKGNAVPYDDDDDSLDESFSALEEELRLIV